MSSTVVSTYAQLTPLSTVVILSHPTVSLKPSSFWPLHQPKVHGTMWQRLAFLVTTLLIAPSGADRYTPPLGRARNGSYHGIYNEHYGVETFLGIPFAQPPVANLRLRQPQSLNSSWHGVRNATAYGDSCVGYGDDTELVSDGHVSEDCLTLNIIRPAGTVDCSNLPVLVWIYG